VGGFVEKRGERERDGGDGHCLVPDSEGMTRPRLS